MPWKLLWAVLAAATGAEARLAFQSVKNEQKHIYLSSDRGTERVAATDGKRWHLFPALDAPGRWLAYVEGEDERDLQVVLQPLSGDGTVDGARRERWTSQAGRHRHPCFSGDGKTLAFSGPYGPKGEERVAYVSVPETLRGKAEGSPKVRKTRVTVVPGEVPATYPAVSSDGRLLVFQRMYEDGSRDLALYDVKTGKTEALTARDGMAEAPALSFDDRWLAYAAQGKNNWDIFLLDLQNRTTPPIRVTEAASVDIAPRFRPDGSLLFVSERGGRKQIYEVKANTLAAGGKQAEELVTGDADFESPSVSGSEDFGQAMMPGLPDPERVAFAAAAIDGKLYVASGSLDELDLASGKWRRLSARPNASRDFPLVAHAVGERGKRRVYLYALGGLVHSGEHEPNYRSVDAIDRYDVARDKWETVGHLRAPRSSHVAVLSQGKVHIIAGRDATPRTKGDREGRYFATIEVFDAESELVTAAAESLPEPLRRATSATALGEEIVIAGASALTAYHPATGRFREVAKFAGTNAVVTPLGDGLALFAAPHHVFLLPKGADTVRHAGRYLRESRQRMVVVPLAADTAGILGTNGVELISVAAKARR